MKQYILFILLVLNIVGCATMQRREHFDQANFDSMNNVAVLVTESKAKAAGNAWFWYLDTHEFSLPIAWYVNNMWDYSRPITMESGDSGSGISWKMEYGGLDSRLTVDKKMSKALNDYLHLTGYDIKKSLRYVFIHEFEQIKPFNIINSQKVEDEYTNFISQDKSEKGWNDFQKRLQKDLSADTLILININLWGFHRGMMSKKGNFAIISTFRIIRLSDSAELWEDLVAVDFFNQEYKKENKDFEEFLRGDKAIFSQTLQELIEIVIANFFKRLTF